MPSNRVAIDLFCGCGGMSAGLRNAGFRVLAGADIEENYIQTYRMNFPEAESIDADLSTFCPEDLLSMMNLKRGQLDLLAGGPPCQGFSKNVPRSQRSYDLKNNLLIHTFLDYCDHLRPKLILMENVAEMRNGFDKTYTTQIIEHLRSLGYTVEHSVLNSADFGVPQRRRRAFFIAAADNARVAFPCQTHQKQSSDKASFQLFHHEKHVSVWDAIGDLPSLVHGSGIEPCQYQSSPMTAFQAKVRNPSGTVMNHVARHLKKTQYERLASLGPGQGHKDLPKHLQVRAGYSGAYGRLTKDMVAPTITRWVFHPGSGRFGHPVDVRTITMRETARIQSFDDSFVFAGSYVQQAGQLGNAVPPLLAEKIAEGLPS